MGRTKKFINKENAVKFYLGHRSLRDPLYLEESIGERVLVPAEPIKNSKLAKEFQEPTRRQETEEEIEKRKEEERKFGIYFEDDYNYLQHLKEIEDDFEVEAQEYVEEEKEEKIDVSTINKPKKLMLPSSVFASKYEEEVGYFNQDAPNSDPKIGWDSEIVETLDDESKFEFDKDDNQLDDDFFIKANDEVSGIK
jgi:protein LTV1